MTHCIILPNTWTPPKYHFGQLLKQGEIVGMEYYADGTNRARAHGEGWMYSVLPDPHSEDTESFGESTIKPLTPEKLRTLIQDEAESHSRKKAVLLEQLEQLEQGIEHGKH